MDKNKIFKAVIPAAALCAALSACDKDDPTPAPLPGGQAATAKYVIAASATGTGGTTTNVLVTAESLDSGYVDISGNGLVNDGASYWVFLNNQYLYGLVYNKGNAGITRSYVLKNGAVDARAKEYEVSRFTTFGLYDDKIFTASTGDGPKELADANGFIPKYFLFNYLDSKAETYTGNDTGNEAYRSENFLGNGEYVTLAGFEQVGDKIFAAAVPMGLSQYGVKAEGGKWVKYPELVTTEAGGSGSGSYKAGELQWTQYPDECHIAIFDNADFTSKKLIKTDKISYACGRSRSQYYQTIRQSSAGDIYVFSPSYAKTFKNAVQRTKLPAGVVRIKKGAADFDPGYYVDIEKLSGGKSFLKVFHMGGDNFLLLMYDTELKPGASLNANKLAVFNASKATLEYVKGLPEPEHITSFGRSDNVYTENGFAYQLITTDNDAPAVYKIDPATATATKGLVVKNATSLDGLGKMEESK